MDPIIQFLNKDILPEDKSKAEKICRKAPRFCLSEDQKLYKRLFSGPYLLCILPKALKLLLEELHEGIYGSHTGGRSIAHKTITQGYWWPNMQKEALEYAKKMRSMSKICTQHIPTMRILESPFQSLAFCT